MAIVEQPVTQIEPSSELIAKERYTSKEYLALERERLWPHVWQMACRVEEIPNVGDYIEYAIGTQSVLIVRESADSIRAYRNSCLHRGTRLAEGCGALADDEIRCRFHGWAWALDGSISEVPDAHDFDPERVTRAALQLPEALVGTWGGFVFVNLDRDAGSLEEFLGPIPAVYAPFEPEKMRFLKFTTTVMECNWKAGVDAFNEAYHLEATHMWDLSGMAGSYGMASALDARRKGRDASGATRGSHAFRYDIYRNTNMMSITERATQEGPLVGELAGDPRAAVRKMLTVQISMSLAHTDEVDHLDSLDEMPLDMPLNDFFVLLRKESGKRRGLDYSHLSDYDVLGMLDFCFYPNLVGPITAGNWNFFRFRPNGDDPDTCLFDWMCLHRYGDDEVVAPLEKAWYPDWRMTRDWGPVISQDLDNMGKVQRGMHEETYPGLRLGRQEEGIRNLHRFLDRYIGDSRPAVTSRRAMT